MRSAPRSIPLASLLLCTTGVLGAGLLTCTAQPFVKSVAPAVPPPAVDATRLEAHVRKLALDLSPRTWEDPKRLDAVAAYVHSAFAEASSSPIEEPTFLVEGRTYRNVVLSLGPRTGDRVVVGAHYDAADALPGADDNASGVAGLLELARALAGVNLGTRVDLVAWTLEEPPFFATAHMGSLHHAQALAAEGIKLRAALSLEMIGCFSDAPNSQRYPAPGMSLVHGDVGDFIALVGRPADGDLLAATKSAMGGATDLPVRSLAAPAWVQGIDWSDHRSYWAVGYPAVMITDTSYLRNVRYHTAQDTPDTLDYRRMAKVVQGTFAAVVALAGSPQ
jgi:hypothetical protein